MRRQIKVILHGEPSIDGLTESERNIFYSTLLKRIYELMTRGK